MKNKQQPFGGVTECFSKFKFCLFFVFGFFFFKFIKLDGIAIRR